MDSVSDIMGWHFGACIFYNKLTTVYLIMQFNLNLMNLNLPT